MRIALDGRVLGHHFPGIGRHLRGLVRALPTVAGDTELLLLSDSDATRERWGSAELPGFRALPCSPLRGRLPGPPYRLARDGAFELFHASHFAASAPGLPCRRVVSVYDLIPLRHRDTLPSPLHRLVYRWLLRRSLGSAHRLITLSEASKKELVEHLGCDPERITVTSSAVDPALTSFAPHDIERVRQSFELEERYVLHLGSIRPHKNLDGLLEVWRDLAPRHPGVALAIAGPAPRGSEQREPRVRWLGHVPDRELGPLFAGAEIYVHPSRAEGFGLPVLEAMACGTAVCCSQLPALAELTADAARRFDPLAPSSIARALHELLGSPREREVLAGRGRARAGEHGWSSVAQQTWQAYSSALTEQLPR